MNTPAPSGRGVRRPVAPKSETIDAVLAELDAAVERYMDGLQDESSELRVQDLERVASYLSKLSDYQRGRGR